MDKAMFATILVMAVSGGVHALDLTGVYEGKQVCKGLLKSGEKDRYAITPLLRITQVGNGLRASVSPGSDYEGTAVDDGKNPAEKGQATMVSCSPSQDASGYAEVLYVKNAKLAGDGVKLTLKGISTYSTATRVGSCTWTYKRVNTENPDVGTCP